MAPIIAVMPMLAAMVALYYGARWYSRWAKSRERVVSALILGGSSKVIMTPDFAAMAHQVLLVEVDGHVEEWSVPAKELFHKAKAGQLARFTLIRRGVCAMELIESATSAQEERAKRLLEEWREVHPWW